MQAIKSFRNEAYFLSNFAPTPFWTPQGTYCPTVEHAFQACKTNDPQQRIWVLTANTPLQAKQRGRHVQLRPDWNEVRLKYMKALVKLKFEQNHDLASLLCATGDALLEEGNYWNDTFWGVDFKTGRGQNHLGKILMEVRTEIREGR
jgi:ribA/ribD-fused uncharacterized protein